MEKENAIKNFVEMIKKSWTYNRMTEKEKTIIVGILYNIRTENATKGTYRQRWEVLQAIYGAYLAGLGYDSPTWRETEPQPF